MAGRAETVPTHPSIPPTPGCCQSPPPPLQGPVGHIESDRDERTRAGAGAWVSPRLQPGRARPGQRQCPAESPAGQGACGKGRSSRRALGGVRPGPQVTRTSLGARSSRAGVTWCGARCWATADSPEQGGARGWSPPADLALPGTTRYKLQPRQSRTHPLPAPPLSLFR